MPRCEILTVGTEILLGDVVDTNAAEIARALRNAGIDVYRKVTVGDNTVRLRDALVDALERADCVIVAGGLGPTVDDTTRQAIADAVGVPLTFRPDLWRQVQEAFRRFGREAPENNRQQAYLPDGSRPILNPVGTAPGIIAESPRGAIVALPGVPGEMRHLLRTDVLPFLHERFGLRETILVRVLRTVGAGESVIDELLADLETLANPTVGLAAHPGRVDVRVVAKAATEAAAEALLAPVETEIRARLGDRVFGTDAQTLEAAVLEMLARRGWCLVAVDAGLAGALVGPLAGTPGPFRRGETLPALARPDDLAPILSAYRARHGADVGLAVSLSDAGGSIEAHAVAICPGLDRATRRSFGGNPALAPARAASVGLDLLRRAMLAGSSAGDPPEEAD